jgi:hypothetical protein
MLLQEGQRFKLDWCDLELGTSARNLLLMSFVPSISHACYFGPSQKQIIHAKRTKKEEPTIRPGKTFVETHPKLWMELLFVTFSQIPPCPLFLTAGEIHEWRVRVAIACRWNEVEDLELRSTLH